MRVMRFLAQPCIRLLAEQERVRGALGVLRWLTWCKDVVETLLRNRAAVNVRDRNLDTPLHLAAGAQDPLSHFSCSC